MTRSSQTVHEQANPLVIGHRGASGYRPEHTLASYELAAHLGADYLEPDLVITADGVLIARHEPMLGATTDVAEHAEFAERQTTKIIRGKEVADEWFAEDFTLPEIKTLRAREPLPELRPHNTSHDGHHAIATLAEIIELARELSTNLGRSIGVYPETKHPTYFRQIGAPLEPPLIDMVHRYELNHPHAKLYIQSFEVTNLQELRSHLDVGLIQLTWVAGAPYDWEVSGDPRTYADLMTPKGLAEVATYAHGIGPKKTSVIEHRADGTLGEPTPLVSHAHEARLAVHPYTFRAENAFLPAEFRSSANHSANHSADRAAEHAAELGDLAGEIRAYFDAGIDGLFTDHPDIAAAALRSRE